MSIPDLAIVIACIAFLITQVNIERTRRRLEKGANKSWARADQTIRETKTELLAELQHQVRDNQPKIPIQELADIKSKLEGIPNYLEDRLGKVSTNLSENFLQLQKVIDQRIDELKKPQITRADNFGDPHEAQSASVLKRKVNEIAGKLDEAALASSFGGRMAMILEQLGYPDLKDWMIEHPQSYPMLVQEIQRRPALKARMDQLVGASQGTPGQIPAGGNRGYDLR